PDDVFALAQSGRRRRVLAGLGQAVDVPDKPIETAGGERVKLAGPAPERKEVGFSLAATGKRRDEVEITGLVVDQAEKPGKGHAPRLGPPGVELSEKRPHPQGQLALVFGKSPHGRVKRPPRLPGADFGQIPLV